MAIAKASIETSQKWATRSGVALMIMCSILTATAGYMLGGADYSTKSIIFALVFGVVTIGAGLLLPFVELAFGRSFIVGCGVLMAWIGFTTGEFVGHVMVVAGQRHSQIDTATHKDQVKLDKRADIASNEDLAKTLRQRKTDLELGKGAGAGWSSTRTPEAWQADIKNLEGDQIYKRSKSCTDVTKPDSRAFCDRLTELKANLAAANSMASVEEQLLATNRKLENLRQEAAIQPGGDSVARTQSDVMASLLTISLEPDGKAKKWSNLGIEIFFAFLMTIGPMSLIYVGAQDWTAERKKKKSMASSLAENYRWVIGIWKGKSDIEMAQDEAARTGHVQIVHKVDDVVKSELASTQAATSDLQQFQAKLRAAARRHLLANQVAA